MKKVTLGIAMAVMFVSCNQPQSATTKTSDLPSSKKHVLAKSLVSSGPFSQFIPIDSANKMLTSYATSINLPANDSDLQSIIFTAESLRQLLSNSNIKNVKLMFAHSLNYINNGGSGINCGYQAGALTLVLAGYDSAGNYQYMPEGLVLETGAPCPSNCPNPGNASSNLLSH